MTITCGVFFVDEDIGWGYEVFDLESNEMLTRQVGYKTVEDALYYAGLAANDLGNIEE